MSESSIKRFKDHFSLKVSDILVNHIMVIDPFVIVQSIAVQGENCENEHLHHV